MTKNAATNEHELEMMEPWPVAYPEELRQIREHLQMTQAEIATALGVTNYTWWRWEAGSPISPTYTKRVRELYEKSFQKPDQPASM